MTEEDISFEKALERLEKIVTALENGELSLDDSLKRYEEGVKLSRMCSKKMTEAEKKIEFLTRSLNIPAGPDENDAEPAEGKTDKKKSRKIAKTQTDRSDDDLLI